MDDDDRAAVRDAPAAPLIITEANGDTPARGSIFDGLKFFLLQRVPQRSRFVADVTNNGGNIVKFESNADFVIADHTRKDVPAGSYSYTFIEAALKNGRLPKPADHLAGRPTGIVRTVGSVEPTKGTRTPFTPKDDLFLWDWVQRKKSEGFAEKGNALYEGLEIANPRHTLQSWRDRYVKRLVFNPPVGAAAATMIPARAPPSPPAEPADDIRPDTTLFTEKDSRVLLREAPDIETLSDDIIEQAWAHWAETKDSHTAEEWHRFYMDHVRPEHIRKLQAAQQHEGGADGTHSSSEQPSVTESKKRKRKTPIPNRAGIYSSPHKRRGFQAGDDLASLRPLDSPDPVITSEANRAAERQLKGDVSRVAKGDKSKVTKQAMVDLSVDQENAEEVNDVRLTPRNKAKPPVWRSDEDEVIFQGLRRGWSSPRIAEALPDDGLQSPSAARYKVATLKEKLKQSMVAQNEDDPLEAAHTPEATLSRSTSTHTLASLLQNAGTALTEANLATQQAQHKPKEHRAVDLPKDHETQDQSDFIHYLKGTLRANKSKLLAEHEAHKDTEDESSSLGSEVPAVAEISEIEETEQLPPDSPPLETLPHESGKFNTKRYVQDGAREAGSENEHRLPLSGQAEIDEALYDSSRWPLSPKQKREKSQAFETQLGHSMPPPSSEKPRVLERQEPKFSGQTFLSRLHDDHQTGLSQDGLPGHNDVPDAEPGLSAAYEVPMGEEEEYEYNSQVENPDELDFRDEEPDLTIAEPDGGFTPEPQPQDEESYLVAQHQSQPKGVVELLSDSSSSSLDDSSPLDPQSPITQQRRKGHAVETQDIWNAETQAPDLGVPMPPESEDDFEEEKDQRELSPPAPSLPTSRRKSGLEEFESQPTGDVNDAELEEWMSTMRVRGYKAESILKAVLCTMQHLQLAYLVLLEEHKGIPRDIRGIWPEEDDLALEGTDASALRKLEVKHGREECEARRKFLEEWRRS